MRRAIALLVCLLFSVSFAGASDDPPAVTEVTGSVVRRGGPSGDGSDGSCHARLVPCLANGNVSGVPQDFGGDDWQAMTDT